MATISFGRSVLVNSDWGIRNLERALDNSRDLSFMYGEYKSHKRATKAVIGRFVNEYKKARPESL